MRTLLPFALIVSLLGCGGVDSGPGLIRPDTKEDCENRGGEWVDSSGGYCEETA